MEALSTRTCAESRDLGVSWSETHTSAGARCLNFVEEDEDGGEVREVS